MTKKTAILLLCAVCVLALSSCNRTEKQVTSVAETFLEAYYSADYVRAAACCTPGFAELVTRDASADVPQEIAQKMKEAVSRTSFNIVSVEVDEEAGTAAVSYELSVPGLDKAVPRTLSLQLEGGTAAVNGIE